MARYLVAIHHPDNCDASREDEAMERDIDVLNREMVAAGVRIFVGGLRPASSAKSLRRQPDGGSGVGRMWGDPVSPTYRKARWVGQPQPC